MFSNKSSRCIVAACLLLSMVAFTLPTRGVEISGRVVDDVGNPIAGALVEWGLVNGTPKSRFHTRTGDDGTYTLTAAEGGRGYRLGASAEGYGPAWRVFNPPWIHISSLDDQPHTVNIPETVDFTLGPAQVLSGKVVDESGAPLSGIEVQVRTAVTGQYSSFSSASWPCLFPGIDAPDTVTDASGNFEFGGLPAGEASITLSAPHRHLNRRNYAVGESHTLKMSWSGRAGQLRGQVLDGETGAPIQNYRLTRRHVPEPVEINSKDGHFQWTDSITEGRGYPIHIYARGYAPLETKVDAFPLEARHNPVFSLTPATPLRLRLVNAQDGSQVPSAEVLYGILAKTRYFLWEEWDRYIDGYHGLSMVQKSATNHDEEIWFCEDAGQPGALFIQAPGFARTIIKPENRPAPDADGLITIPLTVEASLQGKIALLDATESSVGIRLNKIQPDQHPEQELEKITTKEDGSFTFEGLESGDYQLCQEVWLDPWTARIVPVETVTLNAGELRDIGTLARLKQGQELSPRD